MLKLVTILGLSALFPSSCVAESSNGILNRLKNNLIESKGLNGHWSEIPFAGKYGLWFKDATTVSNMRTFECGLACDKSSHCKEAVFYTDHSGAHCYLYSHSCSSVDNQNCFNWKEPGVRTYIKNSPPPNIINNNNNNNNNNVIPSQFPFIRPTPPTSVSSNTLHPNPPTTTTTKPAIATSATTHPPHPHPHPQQPTTKPAAVTAAGVIPSQATTRPAINTLTTTTQAHAPGGAVTFPAEAGAKVPIQNFTPTRKPVLPTATTPATHKPYPDCANGGPKCSDHQQCAQGYRDMYGYTPHYCVCADGYYNANNLVQTRASGIRCVPRQDPCKINNGGCNINASCKTTYPLHRSLATDQVIKCTCKQGYQGDGHTCIPLPPGATIAPAKPTTTPPVTVVVK